MGFDPGAPGNSGQAPRDGWIKRVVGPGLRYVRRGGAQQCNAVLSSRCSPALKKWQRPHTVQGAHTAPPISWSSELKTEQHMRRGTHTTVCL